MHMSSACSISLDCNYESKSAATNSLSSARLTLSAVQPLPYLCGVVGDQGPVVVDHRKRPVHDSDRGIQAGHEKLSTVARVRHGDQPAKPEGVAWVWLLCYRAAHLPLACKSQSTSLHLNCCLALSLASNHDKDVTCQGYVCIHVCICIYVFM